MAITYSTLVERIYRQLSDPDQENPDFTEDGVYDAVVAAHEAILTWVPNYKDVELTAGSDGDLLQLPSDVYDIQAVQLPDDSSKKFIPRATLAAGTARGNTTAENDWTESPKGYLSFAYDLTEGDTVRVYYLAFWGQPANSSDTDFVLEVPPMAYQGIIYYALSVILSPIIMDTSVLGPFRDRTDSGIPTHNPMRDTANWFRSLFLQEMKLMPPYQKARA
jgi:hypothetical protein